MAEYKSWINENKELLLKYKGNWIAYTYEKGLLAYGKTLDEVIKKANKIDKEHIIWHVNEHFGQPRAFGHITTGKRIRKSVETEIATPPSLPIED